MKCTVIVNLILLSGKLVMLTVHCSEGQERFGAVLAMRERFAEYSHLMGICMDSFHKYTATRKLSSAQY